MKKFSSMSYVTILPRDHYNNLIYTVEYYNQKNQESLLPRPCFHQHDPMQAFSWRSCPKGRELLPCEYMKTD